MTLSVGINEARKFAENIDKNLSGYDLCYTALINHEDGSFHVVKNAIVFQWNDYYLVFAEHANYEVYHKEDASVLQLNEIEIDKVNNTLPYVRNLLIDDLEIFLAHQFARKPEKDQILWIKDLDHKFKGRTIKIVSADDLMVNATENFPRQNLWSPEEKEAWEKIKSDPDWIEYQRLTKKFEDINN
jgi:hypothetical protein